MPPHKISHPSKLIELKVQSIYYDMLHVYSINQPCIVKLKFMPWVAIQVVDDWMLKDHSSL